jgi:hypothetical protein
MANYVYIENNEILEYHDQLPMVWKHVSGLNLLDSDESTLNNLGWHKVEQQSIDFDPTEKYIKEYTYNITDGKVYQVPVLDDVAPPDPLQEQVIFENLLNNIRVERDRLLAESDWTQCVDVQAIQTNDWKTAWALYRQQLRDIPNQCISGEINIRSIIWPSKP